MKWEASFSFFLHLKFLFPLFFGYESIKVFICILRKVLLSCISYRFRLLHVVIASLPLSIIVEFSCKIYERKL